MNRKKKKLKKLFDFPESWEEHWKGMPEFIQKDKSPFQTIIVHFKNQEDVKKFSELTEQKITKKTKYIWYPKQRKKPLIKLKYIDS